MATNYLLTITCADRSGLVSAITGELFNIGINLCDATFSVIGTAAEFSAVLETADNLRPEEILAHLKAVEVLEAADIKITPFTFGTMRSDSAHITHHITFEGADQPGLIARLTELLVDYGANIVRLDARTIEHSGYFIELWIWIQEPRADACLAALSNTAASLGMRCTVKGQ